MRGPPSSPGARTTTTPTAAPTDGNRSDDDTDNGTDDDEREATPATLEQQVREFLTLQANGLFEVACGRLADAAAEQSMRAGLENGWRQVARGSGRFQSVLDTESQTVESGVATRVETADRLLKNTWQVSVTDAGILGFSATSQEAHAWDPPAHADRSAFGERTVTLDVTDSCDLGGTLSVPTGEEPVLGVVIVHGSGPATVTGHSVRTDRTRNSRGGSPAVVSPCYATTSEPLPVTSPCRNSVSTIRPRTTRSDDSGQRSAWRTGGCSLSVTVSGGS